MKPTLTDLAIRYASDKWYFHSYIPAYESLFAGRKVRRLLEIGIGYAGLMQPLLPHGIEFVPGSSLRMWADYFTDAEIFGCDIREETLINEGRIRTVVCDQSDRRSLQRMAIEFGVYDHPGGGWEIIIDDGSHQLEHQKLTWEALYPYLEEGGVYVVEDVQRPEELAAHTGGTIHRFDKRPDDVLVVIKNDKTQF